MTVPAPVRLKLFGNFAALIDGMPVTTFESDKARGLLAYLSLGYMGADMGQAYSRETLVTLFWPEEDAATGRRNLRQTLYSLRRSLQEKEEGRLLQASRQEIRLALPNPQAVDAVAFHMLYAECLAHPHRQIDACPECAERQRQMVDLAQGELMAGFTLADAEEFNDWLAARREEYRVRLQGAASNLAHFYERRREYAIAELYYRRLMDLEAWDEEVIRGLMRCLALGGQPGAALRQYEALYSTLQRELNGAPDPQTTALAAQIRAGTLHADLERAANPYKGLDAFGVHDAADFYGREETTARLAQAVDTHAVVVLIGPSGSGKSSVVQAGLLAHLAVQRAASPEGVTPRWSVIMRPGKNPFRALARALTPYLGASQTAESFAEALQSGKRTLYALALQHRHREEADRPERLLLIVDQFEELFTLCTDAAQRRAFIDLLLLGNFGATPPAPFSVLLSLRGDFLNDLLTYRPLADAFQQGAFILGPLSREELRRAVSEPAQAQGVSFEPGLLDRLLADASDEPGNLPLLQFALTLLWERQEEKRMTHTAYEQIGGIAGALATYAEQVFVTLNAADQERAKRIFLRMVRQHADALHTSRPISRTELEAEEWRVAQMLADRRLLVTNRTIGGQETAEMAHEAMIQAWDRLHGWLQSDRAFHAWQSRVQTAYQQWEISQRDAGALLRGFLLVEAEEWLQQRRDDIGPQELALIAASQKCRDDELRAIENQKEEELRNAQIATAEAEKRAAAEVRSSWRLRVLTYMLLGSLILAVIALSSAILSAQNARIRADEAQFAQSIAEKASRNAAEQADLALSRQLGAQSVSSQNKELDLALLLGMESERLSPIQDGTAACCQNDLFLNLQFSPLIAAYLHGETTPVHNLAFATADPDVLIASAEGGIKRWNVAERRMTGALLPDPEGDFAALSPDGARAVTWLESSMTLWNLTASPIISTTFTDHAGEIDFLTFSTSGRFLISGSRDGALILRDARSGKVIKTLIYDGSGGMALNADASRLAMFDDLDGRIGLEIWDLIQGKPIAGPVFGHDLGVGSIVYSQDGKLLATTGDDKTVRLWDGETGEPVGKPLIGHSGRVLAAAFSPDGSVLATGGTDNVVLLWDVATGELMGQPLTGHSNWVRRVVFSADGHALVSGDADGNIILWNLATRQRLSGHTDRVRVVIVSPDGKTLYTTSYDRTIRVWDAQTGELQQVVATEHVGAIIQAAMSPDGRTFATGDTNGVVILWDRATLQPVFPPQAPVEAIVIGMDYSPDSRTLATGDFKGNIILWDVATGAHNEPLLAHPDAWVVALAFSPDGKTLASGGIDHLVRLWDVHLGLKGEDAQLTPRGQPAPGHTNWVTSLRFTPDGKWLFSGSSDKTIRRRDAATGALIGDPWTGHGAPVWSLHLLAQETGQTLFSLGGDGVVLAWNTATGALRGPAWLTYDETENMAMSPDGRSFFLGSTGVAAQIWHVDTRPWQERACAIANRNLTAAEWQEYLREKPYRMTCAALP